MTWYNVINYIKLNKQKKACQCTNGVADSTNNCASDADGLLCGSCNAGFRLNVSTGSSDGKKKYKACLPRKKTKNKSGPVTLMQKGKKKNTKSSEI